MAGQPNLPVVGQAPHTLGQEVPLIANVPGLQIQQQLQQIQQGPQALQQALQQAIQQLDERSSIRAMNSKQALNGPLAPTLVQGQPVPAECPCHTCGPDHAAQCWSFSTITILYQYQRQLWLAMWRQLAHFLGVSLRFQVTPVLLGLEQCYEGSAHCAAVILGLAQPCCCAAIEANH